MEKTQGVASYYRIITLALKYRVRRSALLSGYHLHEYVWGLPQPWDLPLFMPKGSGTISFTIYPLIMPNLSEIINEQESQTFVAVVPSGYRGCKA